MDWWHWYVVDGICAGAEREDDLRLEGDDEISFEISFNTNEDPGVKVPIKAIEDSENRYRLIGVTAEHSPSMSEYVLIRGEIALLNNEAPQKGRKPEVVATVYNAQKEVIGTTEEELSRPTSHTAIPFEITAVCSESHGSPAGAKIFIR